MNLEAQIAKIIEANGAALYDTEIQNLMKRFTVF